MIAKSPGKKKRKYKHKHWNTKFEDTMYVKAYQLARQGMKGKALANTLGVQIDTLIRWKKANPAFKEAIEQGRSQFKRATTGMDTFRDYVYSSLPAELKELWEKIEECNDPESGSGVEMIEALLEDKGKYVKMHLFLYALPVRNFNVSEACKSVNITTAEFRKWIKTEPFFAQLVDEFHFHKGNFFEGHLINLVSRGDTAATIFANKTFNRDRGYDEKQRVEVQHSMSGNMIDLETLELPLEVRKQVLLAVRAAKAKQEGNGMPMLEYRVDKGGKAVPVEELPEE